MKLAPRTKFFFKLTINVAENEINAFLQLFSYNDNSGMSK